MIKSIPLYAFLFSGICFLFGTSKFDTMSASNYNIIPYPRLLIPQSGSFTFNKHTTVYCPFDKPEVLKLAQQFSAQMELVSGLKLEVKDASKAKGSNVVIFETTDKDYTSETYLLSISPGGIKIRAAAANGFFYGLQSLYQLLPPEIYGKKTATAVKWSAPSAEIKDAPRFSYRGLHLDVCRHFFPVEFIKKYIDAMAIHKFNTFHWHLTDDQGWRIEIKKYPRLTEVGSRRDETLLDYYYDRFPQQFDGKPYGGYYTQAEAREIVAYAKARFITVIPEIEMPGHAQAAIAAYPYLSCTQDSTIKVETKWGVFKEVFCPLDTTFRFLEDVLTEVMDIFPGKYIHIGGDECPKDRWKACPDCQAMIARLDLKDENGLQSYFVHHMERFLNSKGRKIIGWDEILDGGLDPNATVMSWRGTQGGITAAKAGNDVIMTPTAYCYFDKYQADPVFEPVTIGGYLPLKNVYNYEPVPTELTDDEAKHILGAQANMWAEYMPTSERVEYMAYPRVSAMAEVLWSSKKMRNWELFAQRMPKEFERYNQLGIEPSKAFYDVQFQSTITADRKLQITLVCDCPGAVIQYTIDGKTVVYKEPFTLSESANISAIALINGKQLGKTIAKPFTVSKLTGLTYTKNPTNTWYDGGKINALTDGVPGTEKTYDQWLGYGKGTDAEIVLDMLTVQKVERFTVGLLNAPAMCALVSPDIKLYGSVDGVSYQLLAGKQPVAPTSPDKVIVRPEMTFPAVDVRYLKLQLKNANYCPADKLENAPCSMLFLDEVGAW
ncbi:MAG: family 20 glycosylhydrolase [Paludibacter sp.]|nr:family 20 glycosylhydrolase [Paludibacter sp.]